MNWKAVIPFLAAVLPLSGAPVVLESFDMAANPPAMVGTEGAYGGNTSTGWMSTWVTSEGGAQYLKRDLSFPALASSGGSIRLQNNSTLMRQLGQSFEGTVYGSFRVFVPNAGDNAIVGLLFGLPGEEALTPKTALASFLVKGWKSRRGVIGDRGNMFPIKDGAELPMGETVLILWKMEKLPKPGKRSDQVIQLWMLNAEQVAHFAAEGMNEENLREANAGAAANEVLQTMRVTPKGSKFTLLKGLVVACTAKWVGKVSFDEMRISTKDMAEAAGVLPPGTVKAEPAPIDDFVPVPLGKTKNESKKPKKRAAGPNVLLVTVDDMNWDSLGVTGCSLDGISPHIDGLAAEGMRFGQAFLQAPSCSPSRNALHSGRYPHTNGVIGFFNVAPNYANLPEVLRANDYYTGVVNKAADSSPNAEFDRYWDHVAGFSQADKRKPASYREKTAAFLVAAKKAKRPFFGVINIADPHKPFFNDPAAQKGDAPEPLPSRVYAHDEVEIPPFLAEHPVIRQDVRNYYNSVKRADDCVGEVLAALEDSGLAEKTAVIFLSDHGMPMPFAKTSLYRNGIRTPWIVRWPGEVEAGAINREDMISAVDLMPTVLEMAAIEIPRGVQGRSFLPLLKGTKDPGRDELIFAEYHENSSGIPRPMRAVHSPRFGYHFNPWADGEVEFISAASFHASYQAMKEMAADDAEVAARFNHWLKRSVEELYDYQKDPHALHNLIDDPAHAAVAEQLRGELEAWMQATQDPLLTVFRERAEPGRLTAFVAAEDARSLARAETIQWKRWNNRAGKTKDQQELVTLN